eukprot:gene12940-7520_t
MEEYIKILEKKEYTLHKNENGECKEINASVYFKIKEAKENIEKINNLINNHIMEQNELEFIASILKQRKGDLKTQKYYADCNTQDYEKGLISNLNIYEHRKMEKKETKDYRNMRDEVLEFMTDAMIFQDEKFYHNVYPMFKELWGEIDIDGIKNIIGAARVFNHIYYNNFDLPQKDYYFRINKQKNQHLIKIITNVLQYLEIENVS